MSRSNWDDLESIIKHVELVPGSGEFIKGQTVGIPVGIDGIVWVTANGDGTYTLEDGTIWPGEETK